MNSPDVSLQLVHTIFLSNSETVNANFNSTRIRIRPGRTVHHAEKALKWENSSGVGRKVQTT